MEVNKVKLVFNAKRVNGGNVFGADIVKEAATFSQALAAIQADVQAKVDAEQAVLSEIQQAQSLLNS